MESQGEFGFVVILFCVPRFVFRWHRAFTRPFCCTVLQFFLFILAASSMWPFWQLPQHISSKHLKQKKHTPLPHSPLLIDFNHLLKSNLATRGEVSKVSCEKIGLGRCDYSWSSSLQAGNSKSWRLCPTLVRLLLFGWYSSHPSPSLSHCGLSPFLHQRQFRET